RNMQVIACMSTGSAKRAASLGVAGPVGVTPYCRPAPALDCAAKGTRRMLDRRRFTFALLVAAAAGPALAQAQLSQPDQALVARAVAYLEGLKQAKARFVQTDSRGQTSTGTLYLKRPGKARFAYDPPSGLLVVSNGSTVAVADSRLKSFDSYPLGMTP